MVAKTGIQLDPIVEELLKQLKQRNVSIAAFGKHVNIPPSRIYKWKDEGNSPKADDVAKIKRWISLDHEGNTEKVPHETIGENAGNDGVFLNGPIKLTAQEYVDALKRDKEQLQKVVDTSLQAMQLMLDSLRRHDQAFHETILRSLARLEKDPGDQLILEARTREAALLLEEKGKGILEKGT